MKITANGFTTEVPDEWDDRTMQTFVGPTGRAGFAANIVITRERVAASTKIEDYAAQQRLAVEAEVPTLEILDERVTTINNAPAFQRLQRFTIEDYHLQQAQTFISAGEVVFVITSTSEVADFDQQIPAFRRIVENFRIS